MNKSVQWILMGVICAQSVWAQDLAAVEKEDDVQLDQISMSSGEVLNASHEDGLITLRVEDVELQDIIRLFSRMAHANIIVSDLFDTDGPQRVDVNLEGVEWKPALQSILDAFDLELYEKFPDSEVYVVRTRAPDAPEPQLIQIFKLKYATVDGIQTLVSGIVGGTGSVAVFPARNTLVIQSTARVLSEIEGIITAVDLPREQVFIEAKFMELSDSASEKLGIDWQVLGGYNVGVSGIGGTYNRSNIRTDTSSTGYDAQENRYTDMHGNPYEELIEEPGEIPSYQDGDRIYGMTPTTSFEAFQSVLDSEEDIVSTTLGATLSAGDFELVLAALKEMNGTKIVSNPKVIVANEELASIHIGTKKPNIRGTIQTAGDSQSTTVYSLDEDEPYFEDGIKVDVTPTINTHSNITVSIQPTLDRLDVFPTYAPDGTEYYGKSTKTIHTMFSLENGQTAAIGGLTESSSNDISRKVPILGSLPIIGRLFSYSEKTEEQVETIIFVTVGLANPENINMNTGLPQDSTLAIREHLTSQTDRKIHERKVDLFEAEEAQRLIKEEKALIRKQKKLGADESDETSELDRDQE